MRTFELHRDVDVSGVSGPGVVAQGIEFDDGSVAVRWLSDYATTTVHDRGLESVEFIHGHGGLTRVVYVDQAA